MKLEVGTKVKVKLGTFTHRIGTVESVEDNGDGFVMYVVNGKVYDSSKVSPLKVEHDFTDTLKKQVEMIPELEVDMAHWLVLQTQYANDGSDKSETILARALKLYEDKFGTFTAVLPLNFGY
jgi:hypothetical protein